MVVLFYICLFLFIFASGLIYTTVDYDFWARLIVGKTYFQTGEILKNDFLSYTPTHPWYDHEWGSSLLFYFVQDHFGDIGLFLLKTILIFLTFVLIIEVIKLRYKKCTCSADKEKEKTLYLSFLFFFFAIHAVNNIIFMQVRCQSLTFFFFALWLYVLERVRLNNENRLLWILPATMLVWSNSHGGCFAGLGLLGLYIAGEFLSKKPIKKYIITFAICTLVLFINPYGIGYVQYLVMATTMKRPAITEWQATFSSGYFYKFVKFKLYLTIILITVGINFIKNFLGQRFWDKEFLKSWWRNCDKTKLLIILIMTLLSLKAVRFQSFFVFSACAFLYCDFYNVFNKKLPKAWDIAKDLFFFAAVLIWTYSMTASTKLMSDVNYLTYPTAEIDFIKANNLKGNLISAFHHGSYAMYKLYPNVHLYMDGRYEETYIENLIENLGNIEQGQITKDETSWTRAIEKYYPDMIIVSKRTPISTSIKFSKDWQLLMHSEAYALYGRAGKYNTKKLKQIVVKSQHEFDLKKFDTNIDWH